MSGIWALGVIAFICWRLVNAGMNREKLFFREKTRYGQATTIELDGDKVFAYTALTLFIAIIWIIAIPAFGLYYLGTKLGKKS